MQGMAAFAVGSWRQARYHIKRVRLIRRYMGTSALPGPGRAEVLRHVEGRRLKVKVDHGPAAGPATRSLIDPNIIHQQRLGKRRAGIGTSGPLSPDRDVEDQKERVVEHPP